MSLNIYFKTFHLQIFVYLAPLVQKLPYLTSHYITGASTISSFPSLYRFLHILYRKNLKTTSGRNISAYTRAISFHWASLDAFFVRVERVQNRALVTSYFSGFSDREFSIFPGHAGCGKANAFTFSKRRLVGT